MNQDASLCYASYLHPAVLPAMMAPVITLVMVCHHSNRAMAKTDTVTTELPVGKRSYKWVDQKLHQSL